jgi:hypothetical protein
MILGYTMSRYIIKAMYQEKPKRLIIWNGWEYIATKKNSVLSLQIESWTI